MACGYPSLISGLNRIRCPVLVSALTCTGRKSRIPFLFFLKVLGVWSDILFPVRQQRELTEALKKSGM